MLTIGSLFSGIGGLELGLERAGLGPVKWQVEIDDYCNKVLEKHWPDSRRYRDIYEIQELEPVELICGGFPCQPVSCAGGRKAQADDRWLWPEFVRIIRMVKPRWVVAENVPGLLTANDNRAMGEVLRDLALCGYDIEWDCVSAQSVGAWHKRDRIFVVAHSEQVGRAEGAVEQGEVRGLAEERDSSDKSDNTGEARAVSDSPGDGRSDRLQDDITGSEGATAEEERPRRLPEEHHGESCEGLGVRSVTQRGQDVLEEYRGRNQWGVWKFDPSEDRTVEPSVGRVAHGVPARVDRLKCLGNAVVPQVAEVIGLLIMEHERVMAEGA